MLRLFMKTVKSIINLYSIRPFLRGGNEHSAWITEESRYRGSRKGPMSQRLGWFLDKEKVYCVAFIVNRNPARRSLICERDNIVENEAS